MRIPDHILLAIYKKKGMTDEQAEATLKRVRNTPVDPGLTFPDIDNAADDSYFKQVGGIRYE